MEAFRISHLPIIKDGEYLGLISDKDIYDKGLEMCRLGEKLTSLFNPSVRVDQHLYEVARKIMELNLSSIPVLDLNGQYVGLITINDLSSKIVGLFMVREPGAVIVLEMSPTDYSLTQIAQIIESNDAKILSFYTSMPHESHLMHVSLKVNLSDVSSIIQTFVRYNYNIFAVYMDDSMLHDMYSERFDLFMKFLNI